ncbi:MAG: hypothetical protein A3K19_15210 [Lentisphaerae bacterium RIFOXYB12_FULL_65_16]|nr:MAG: hypothetical protein A3K18_06910 [Lentisphaerae bacterium RIFOXYA12_64_32]OGV88440.1 MAG: hypothetical protein A3K19_15210 [Lentisphaerae bacterium RIFOXYB12_FULL_65_16]
MRVSIPRPVQLVIDDVGWREGWRDDAQGGPFRAGLNRLLGPADYAAIAAVGAALGIRPTAAMVLCEWDKTNACATQPTCTQAGTAWDNRPRAGAWSDETAELFRNRAAHLELAMHGVGHEHWDNGVRTRAEWYSQFKQKWRWPDLQGHLRVFREILDQHGLGPAAGHRLPPNFIPCAFQYLWDEADPESTSALIATAGVRYGSTPYSCLDRRSPLLAADGGVDHGVLMLDRGNSGVPWDVVDRVPANVHGESAGAESAAPGSICGIHWPNLLSETPEQNHIAVGHWVEYLRKVAAVPGQFLAANARESFAQWAYHRFGRIVSRDGGFELDLSAVPGPVISIIGDMPVIVEVSGAAAAEFAFAGAGPVLWQRQQDGRTFLALKHAGTARMATSRRAARAESAPRPLVRRDGTFNVLDLRPAATGLELDIEMYGTQPVTIVPGFAPGACEVTHGRLRIVARREDAADRTLTLQIAGHDIQGETGTLRIARTGCGHPSPVDAARVLNR